MYWVPLTLITGKLQKHIKVHIIKRHTTVRLLFLLISRNISLTSLDLKNNVIIAIPNAKLRAVKPANNGNFNKKQKTTIN